jgi:hypothetical protein
MPYRLRYLAHDLELPVGEFVVGRSTDCQLIRSCRAATR